MFLFFFFFLSSNRKKYWSFPLFKFKKKILLEKQIYREEKQKNHSFDDLTRKWPQWSELTPSEARSFFRVWNAGAGSQGFGPSLTAFPGHK